jgi:hypothetical protein
MDWQVDFTPMPPARKIKYLLVLFGTFTEWVEAFPTTNKKASIVTTILVTIIPQSYHGLASRPPSSQTMGPSLSPLFLKNWYKP